MNLLNSLSRTAWKKTAGILLFFSLSFYFSLAQELVSPASAVYSLIPKPVSVRPKAQGAVRIDNNTVILADARYRDQAIYLQQQLRQQCGLQLSIRANATQKVIILEHDDTHPDKPEMYCFTAGKDRVSIRAGDVEGMVHGIQTLLQLLPLQPSVQVLVPEVDIEDYPRFRYRGMHLDVSRHFFPVSFIKKYIDYLAFHKFNSFHWHLSDDQGWRVEIKSYPKLTSVGGWRDSTLIGHFRDTPARYDGTRYGGYYTQDQIKEIIRYASVRGITIIPEIDIPGHSRAAIASYPELSTSPDTAWRVATTWGMYNRQNNVLAPTDATFRFLKAVFSEIADLFPSPYIHVGGDECSKIWWKNDPETKAFMKDKNLEDETALQTYFIKYVIKQLEAKRKKAVGWDEILEPGLDRSAIIMNWRGVNAAIKAAEKGHDVIMSPGKPFYFDYYQTKQRDSLAIGGYNSLDSVYLFEPIPAKVAEQGLGERVLGAQGNVWTEYMLYPSKVEYMIFPRMTALSEVLWTDKENKDLPDFKRRLKQTAVPRYKFWSSSYFRDFDRE